MPPSSPVAITLATLVGATLLAVAAESSAQAIPSPYRFVETAQEAGAALGFLRPDRGRFSFGPGPGQVLGSHYQIRVGGPFSLQGVAAYMPTTRDVIDPRRDEGDRKIGEADATIASVDARLHFTLTGDRTWNRLAPHFVVGGGVAFDMAPGQAIDGDLEGDDRFEFGPSFLGVLGIGFSVSASERIVLRGESIATYWKLNTPRGYLRVDRDLGSPGESEWVSGVGLSFGAAYRF